MSSVLCKFRISGCKPIRRADYGRDESGQAGIVDAGPAVEVALSPVQGEPFGKYTPNGQMSMTILNGAAAKVFLDRWNAYVQSHDVKAQAPEFYVRLTPAEEVDSGQQEA